MSQCVPSWEVDDPPAATSLPLHDQPSSAAAPLVPLDYEVAELTWENGQLALHGFGGSPRMGKPVVKSPPAAAAGTGANASWSKHQLPGAGGTLESVVNQATGVKLFPATAAAAAAGGGRTLGLGGWLGGPHHGGDGGVPAVLLDALVPCRDDADAGAGRRVPDAAAAADGDAGRKRTRAMVGVQCSSQGSAAAPRGRRMESTLVTIDTCGTTDDFGITNTATATATATTMATNSVSLDEGGDGSPDTDSVSHSRRSQPQRDGCEEDTKASKKSRAAAIHNQSERKRRDRINQKMKTLQKLVPNSSKTDKASILDEVIEYLKQLQAQVQVMSRMNSMMMPMAMPPQLQMSIMANMAHMAQMAQMAQMGMMDAGAVSRAPAAYPPPPLPPLLHPSAAAAFLPAAAAGTWDGGYAADQMAQQPAAGGSVLPDPLSALIACQSAQQPMTMDAYSRMATLFQQFYQQQQQQPAPPPNPKT